MFIQGLWFPFLDLDLHWLDLIVPVDIQTLHAVLDGFDDGTTLHIEFDVTFCEAKRAIFRLFGIAKGTEFFTKKIHVCQRLERV